MTLNSYFDRIFCINLDVRRDRWKRCLEIFAQHDLQVKRYSAIDGRLLPRSPGMMPGEIGCTASHLEVLSKIVDEGYERALILEDDVEFVEDLQSKFDALVHELPLDWDMLYLGGNHVDPPTPVTAKVARLNATYTTSSYAVSGGFAKRLQQWILADRDKIDVAYSVLHKRHRCYIVTPNLAWQRPGFSDIQGKMTDYFWMKP